MPMQICKTEDTGFQPCGCATWQSGAVLVNQHTTASQLANDDKEDC